LPNVQKNLKKLGPKDQKKFQNEANALRELYKGQLKDFEAHGYYFTDHHESVLRKRGPAKETPKGKSRSKSRGKRAKKSTEE